MHVELGSASAGQSWAAVSESCGMCTQLEERNALVAKLQSQLEIALRLLKGASSSTGAKIVLPPQLASPAGTPNIASARLSYAGGGVL